MCVTGGEFAVDRVYIVSRTAALLNVTYKLDEIQRAITRQQQETYDDEESHGVEGNLQEQAAFDNAKEVNDPDDPDFVMQDNAEADPFINEADMQKRTVPTPRKRAQVDRQSTSI
ncbi:uncharacterized protein LOC107223475 [Neodiprion lecontei]|uniref:Uncharacterized protein LOC107223475 n=1 Tax=Neodiprion lecontei TaxID=441921 RepID=A0A6J0BW31_NEOLC|nr:uncharacterized protein LOC107223475 [Neodiprion lecontei]